MLGSTRALVTCLAVTCAIALAGGAAGADISQTPKATGCPAGFTLLNVAVIEASGPYPDAVFGALDRGGNNDGFVCGNAQPPSVVAAYCRLGAEIACELQALGLPHYVLKEDDSPASQNA